MSYHKHLTLILLVHDNIQFPKRWIEYASFIKLPYKIFIADGGKSSLFNDYINQNLDKLNLDIELFKYSHEKCFSDYYKKSNDILSKVKTAYVAICSDDDFVLPLGIEKSIKFLEENKSYSSARGEMLGVFFQNYLNKDYTYGEDYEILNSAATSFSLEDRSCETRLLTHLEHYQITYYDIHRTKYLQFAYQKLLELNPTAYILAEIITSGFTVMQGKVYRNNYPFMIKDHGPSGITYNEKKVTSNLDWLTKTQWGFEYNQIIHSFEEFLKANEGDTINKNNNLHYAHIKFYRKALIKNLYQKENFLIKAIMYLASRLDLVFNVKSLFSKLNLITKQKFNKIEVKKNMIIKNKSHVNSNKDFNNFVNFIKKNSKNY